MHKQALAVSLVILALVSCVVAFDSLKLFESQFYQKGSTNLCCLPNVFSYNTTFNTVTINNTTLSSDGSMSFYVDYNLGKIKQIGSFTISGKVYSFTLWDFKVSDSITVEYRVPFAGICTCGKIQAEKDKWTPTCIPMSEKMTKGTIGKYQANRVETVNKYGQNVAYWVFSNEEAPIENGKCWLLNSNTFTFTGSTEAMYYDQTAKVDEEIFKVPSYCPTIDKCLNQ